MDRKKLWENMQIRRKWRKKTKFQVLSAFLARSRMCPWSNIWHHRTLIEQTGCETQHISKGVNKTALFYIEQTVTVDIVLFYMWGQVFLLIYRNMCILIPTLWCAKWRSTNKNVTKKLASFTTRLALSTVFALKCASQQIQIGKNHWAKTVMAFKIIIIGLAHFAIFKHPENS